MIKIILIICIVGSSFGQAGGWQDYHGPIPIAVLNSVRKKLLTAENIIVMRMETRNAKSQVVTGVNYKFDVNVTSVGGQIVNCHFLVFQGLSGIARVKSHTC